MPVHSSAVALTYLPSSFSLSLFLSRAFFPLVSLSLSLFLSLSFSLSYSLSLTSFLSRPLSHLLPLSLSLCLSLSLSPLLAFSVAWEAASFVFSIADLSAERRERGFYFF